MLASKHFGLTTGPEDDWFDTILNADTRLFVDPFMVFQEKTGRWARAHDKIVEHFNRAFLLIAEGNRDPQTIAFKKALALLVFREPRELCLGYTDQGTEGAGSGRRYARAIAEAIADAIGRGLKHPKHFEELGILNKGIGADRISDITATILKAELVAYTQEISAKHKIPCSEHEIFAASLMQGVSAGKRRKDPCQLIRIPAVHCSLFQSASYASCQY